VALLGAAAALATPDGGALGGDPAGKECLLEGLGGDFGGGVCDQRGWRSWEVTAGAGALGGDSGGKDLRLRQLGRCGMASLINSSSSEEEERLAALEQLLLRPEALARPLVAPPRLAGLLRSSGRWAFTAAASWDPRSFDLSGLSAPSSSVHAVVEAQGGGGGSGRSPGDTGFTLLFEVCRRGGFLVRTGWLSVLCGGVLLGLGGGVAPVLEDAEVSGGGGR